MQKRLLALVATVAMVLSMFAGIAFADPAQTIAQAKTAVEGLTFAATNATTEAEVTAAVNAVVTGTDIVVVVEGYTLTPATADAAGSITATVKLTQAPNPEETVALNFTIAKLQDLAEAKAAVTSAVGAFAPTNATTEAELLAAAKVAVTNSDIVVTIEGFAKEAATTLAAGTITGTVRLVLATANDTVPVSRAIAQLGIDADEIELNKTKVISSDGNVDYELISGTILEDDKLYTQSVVVTVKNAGGTDLHAPITVTNGRFSFYLNTDLKPQDITVAITGTAVTKTIKVRYNVVTTPAKLEFSFTGEPKPIPITGKVTNSKGEPIDNVAVTLVGAKGGNYFAGMQNTNEKGEFGHVVLNWTDAEDLILSVATFPHAEGEVIAKTATLKVTPNSSVVHSVVAAALKVEGSGFGATGTLTAEITRGDDYTFAVTGLTTDADGKVAGTFNWTPPTDPGAGNYTLTVTKGNYSAETTITVVNPANYNLINSSKLNKLEVKPNNDFEIGTDIKLVNHAGTPGDYFYTVYVDGKLAKNNDSALTPKADFKELLNGGTVRIAATKLATHSIRVVVNAKATDGTVGSKVFDQTYTATVTGWDVTMDVTELTVKTEQDVTFVVKDKDGKAINNAVITIFDSLGGEVDSLGLTYNAQNGTYVFEDVEVNLPGTLEVEFRTHSGTLMATLELDVVGQKVWNVTANKSTLLQGKGEDVELTVTKDGEAVSPWLVKWVYEDGKSNEARPSSYLGEGVSKVKINAAKAGELVVRVENLDGTLCGEVALEVVAPKLVLVDEEVANLTNNFKTKVAFKVVDPRDDSVIKDSLELVKGDYVSDVEVYDANDGVISTTILGAEEHVLTILPKVVKDGWDKAKEDEKTVKVAFKLGTVTVDGAFEVKNATITSDPGMIVIGANNNLTLTYEDANGNPIEGKKITAGDADLGKTDENGQVIYPVSIATAAVKVLAATDVDKVNVEHSIKIGYDAEAPQVDYTLDGNKATIVISDNVRLVRINIDGKEIDFWPGAKYEFVRTLQPGVNKFAIKAQDSNDNVFDEVVEIEYLTDAIVLDGANVSRQGEYLFVQARQFADFGAEFGWNQATKTATFVLDDVKVEVTIGSTTAKVNGETVTMPVAPFLANDRTYVPVRFISENLGWNVHWAAGDVVTITLP